MFRNLSAVGFGEGFTLAHKLALAGKPAQALLALLALLALQKKVWHGLTAV